MSCAPHALSALKAALGDVAAAATEPNALVPAAGQGGAFCDRVVAFIDTHRTCPASIVPLPGSTFSTTCSSLRFLAGGEHATLESLCSSATWSAPVRARLLAAVQATCGAGASLATCFLHDWIHIHSETLNKRVVAGDIVSFFLDIASESDDGGDDDAAAGVGEAAPPAAAAKPPLGVAYPHDARFTSIAAVQAAFSHGGHSYFVAHSYVRAQKQLMDSVRGLDYSKACPRIAGSTLGAAKVPPHFVVIVAEHVGWKVHPHELRNNDVCPTPALGYPFCGPPRVLLQGLFDPLHP